MSLKRAASRTFWAGVVVAAAFTWGLGIARADDPHKKTGNPTPAPSKPAPSHTGAAQPTVSHGAPSGGGTPAAGGTPHSGGTPPAAGGTTHTGGTPAASGTIHAGGTPSTGGGTRPSATPPSSGGTRFGGAPSPSGSTRPTPSTSGGTRFGGNPSTGGGTRFGANSAPYRGHPGEQSSALPGGRTQFRSANGQMVTTNSRGQVSRIEAPRGPAGSRMVVSRGPGGARMVETGRPGARVVSYGPNRGFVERTVRPGFVSRTYVVGGVSYVHVYHSYSYHGFSYYHYIPGVYYGPRFYGWAVTPWAVPVRYSWFGVGISAPWFGYYGGYFAPYPVYRSPDLWLTDYLLAENLRLAYENQQAAYANQAPPPPAEGQQDAAALSPEVKALIADEVRQQLAEERAAAQQPAAVSSPGITGGVSEQVPPALSQRFFVVSSNLDIVTVAGQPCSLTPGDVIERKGKTVATDGGVAVDVVSSKPGDCAADAGAAVQLADLQDMHNQFREKIDSGLKMVADNQAKGLPGAPAADARTVADGTAPPAPDAATQLASQETDAGRLEAQVGN